MRKEYRKAVEVLFTQRLARDLPGFEKVPIDSPLIFGGERVYAWYPAPSFSVFVLLVPSPQGHQSFTLEIGWSVRGRFPESGMRPSIMLGVEDPLPFDVDEGIVRVGGLVDRTDRWWSLPDPAMEHPGSLEALKRSAEPVAPEQAEADAVGPVDEAVDALSTYGIPFLEQLVSDRLGVHATPRSEES